jgi:hypothetical protein
MKIKILVMALTMVVFACQTAEGETIATDKVSLKSVHKQTIISKKRMIRRKSESFGISGFDDIIVDDDTVLGRNRRVQNFGKLIFEQQADIDDYVKIRLMLARMKALKRYQEIYSGA